MNRNLLIKMKINYMNKSLIFRQKNKKFNNKNKKY